VHHDKMSLDDFLRLLGGRRGATRAGFPRGTRQERAGEQERRGERERVSFIACHQA